MGYYCDECFNARHPWYRVAHIYGSIQQNEDIGISLRCQNHDLQLDRQRIDNYQILDNIKKNKLTLEVVADDVVVDSNIRKAARKTVELEVKMNKLRARLRADVRASGGNVEWTEGEAIVVIQKLLRGYRIRKLISRAIAERTIKVWDASSLRGQIAQLETDMMLVHAVMCRICVYICTTTVCICPLLAEFVMYIRMVAEYYFDKFTGESSWTPSRVRPPAALVHRMSVITTAFCSYSSREI